MKRILIGISLLAGLFIASCSGSSNVPAATTGSISGTLTVSGPSSGAALLQVGAFAPGSTTPVQSGEAGRVSSVATVTKTGRTITYSFTELSFGSYEIGLYFTQGSNSTFLYRSDAIALSAVNHNVTGQSGTASFTGPGPFGSISGVTSVAGDWPAAGKLVFLGFAPVSQPSAITQWLVSADQLNNGYLYYNVDGIAHGSYLVGLYAYDPVTHQVTTAGLFDNPVPVTAGSPNVANINFASDFAGDPGTDPVLGSVSGTISFNGALPQGLFIYAAANTIPPQQGAPPAVIEVKPEDIIDGELDYTLGFLPPGEYSVSIFSYNIATHQAVYFGQYSGTVNVAASGAGQHLTGINFNADISLL